MIRLSPPAVGLGYTRLSKGDIALLHQSFFSECYTIRRMTKITSMCCGLVYICFGVFFSPIIDINNRVMRYYRMMVLVVVAMLYLCRFNLPAGGGGA